MLLQVRKAVIPSRQMRRVKKQPLLSVDEPQLHEESFSFPQVEEITEVALEIFLEEVLGGKGHEVEEAFAGGDHEEEMPEIILRAGGSF